MHEKETPAILLEGDGIAAVCVARLLSDAGVPCLWQRNARPKLAAILLGEQTQHMLRELFPATPANPSDLFEGFVQVTRRIVQWGETPEALELPHSGVVAPEGELLQRLWQRVPPLQTYNESTRQQIAWRVLTSRSDTAARPERSIGKREATFAVVEMRPHIPQDACWVESVSCGWLFLLSLGSGKATLISVGGPPEALLLNSRLVAHQISRKLEHKVSVHAHPRLTQTLATTSIIACGSAAMSFDPLCGEGAGNAVREAFLAAAVIRASLAGQPRQSLVAHYTDRLQRGFLRHLQICLQFYSAGGQDTFWKAEAASLLTGIQKMQDSLAHEPAAQFRLMDRDLVPTRS